MKKFVVRLFSFFIAAVMLFAFVPTAHAANWNMEYFLKHYNDWHFDLTKNPDSLMTVEEFVAIVYAYSYYGNGTSTAPAADKTGAQPSAWCAKYVQAEVVKNTVVPSEVSWRSPVTLAFAAKFLARSKGKYAYDFNNIYTFSGVSSLSAEDKMFLNVAADHGLIDYTYGMNASAGIARKDAEKYLIPEGTVSCKAETAAGSVGMKELNGYFIDTYWDFDSSARQLDILKTAGTDYTMVTFASAYISSKQPTAGNSWLTDNVIHAEAMNDARNSSYSRDPQLDAIEYCNQTGKLALLGISNANNNSFDRDRAHELFSSSANMDTAVREICAAVRSHNMDGVTMGFEHLYPTDRQGYSTFLTKLAAALHADDKILTTSVGAYHSKALESASCYDYEKIGAASDYVHVILYDDYPDTSYTYTGKMGAMSEIIRIRRVLRYAMYAMPKNKILLGMSNFAIDYNTTAKTAEDISYTDAEERMNSHNASLKWEGSTAGSYFTYQKDGQNHTVYLESVSGIETRIKLVNKYGLGGSSFYYIYSGYPDAARAVSKLASYKQEIVSAMSSLLIPVSLRGNYQTAITRAEFCALISRFIDRLPSDTASSSDNGQAVNFTDCSDPDVLKVARLGIVTGYSDNTFRPARTISRQEAAVMLGRLAKYAGFTPNAEPVKFAEALPEWAASGVEFISSCEDPSNGKRVMGGTGNGKFSPAGSYTREQSIMTVIRLYHAITL